MDIPRLTPVKNYPSNHRFNPEDHNELNNLAKQNEKLDKLKQQIGDIETGLALLNQNKHTHRLNIDTINSIHYLIGTMYLDGFSADVNINEAIKHFNEVISSLPSVAVRKSLDALFMLYLEGHLFIPAKPEGNTEGCVEDTIMFINWHSGRIDPKDHSLMGKITYRLAMLHESSGNVEKANAYYKDAATHHHPEACIKMAESSDDALTKCHFFLEAARGGHDVGASQFENQIQKTPITPTNSKLIAKLKYQYAEHCKISDSVKAFTYLKQATDRKKSLHNKELFFLADLLCHPKVSCLLEEAELTFYLKKAADCTVPHAGAALKYAQLCLKNEPDFFDKLRDSIDSNALTYFKIASGLGKINEIKAHLFPLIKERHSSNRAKEYYEYFLVLNSLSFNESAFDYLECAHRAQATSTLFSTDISTIISSTYLNTLIGQLGQGLTNLLKRPLTDKPSELLVNTVKLYYKITALKIYSEMEFKQFIRLTRMFTSRMKLNLGQKLKDEFPEEALALFEAALNERVPGALKKFTDLYCELPAFKTNGSTLYKNIEKNLKLATQLPTPNPEVLYRYGEIIFNREIKNAKPAFGKPVFYSLTYFAKAAAENHQMAHFRCIEIYTIRNNHSESAKIVAEAYRTGLFTNPAGYSVKIEVNHAKAEKYLAMSYCSLNKKNTEERISPPANENNASDLEQSIVTPPDETFIQKWVNRINGITATAEYSPYKDL